MHGGAEDQPRVAGLHTPGRPAEDHGGGECGADRADGYLEDAPPAEPGPRPAEGLHHRVPDGFAGDQHEEPQHQRQPRGDGQQQAATVLGEEGTIALDAVDAVAASFDLAHRGGEVEHGEAEAEPHGQSPCRGARAPAGVPQRALHDSTLAPGAILPSVSSITRAMLSVCTVVATPTSAITKGTMPTTT